MTEFELAVPGHLTEAVIDGPYRYLLRRQWNPDLPSLVFVMLNPSTADAKQDDPTIRRCIGFARAQAFGGIDIVNLYAYRTPFPAYLAERARAGWNIEGPKNDHYLRSVIMPGRTVAVAWGAHFGAAEWHWQAVLRVAQIARLNGVDLWCLGTTKDGAPRHPLYVRADTEWETWRP